MLKLSKNIETIKSKGGKILSIGTTTLRALESAAIDISLINKWSSTTLFIKENFEFKIADCLLTNFHLPKINPFDSSFSFFRLRTYHEML